AIIMRALEVDRSERYQNADHMFRDIEAFLEEHGLSTSPRRISAFMAEMFGEGAPAEVDYDGEYDDLVDDALDFDAFDTFLGSGSGSGSGSDSAPETEDDAPDWARDLSGSSQVNPRRSMTIGNLNDLVADVAAGDSGVRERATTTGKQAVAATT